LVIAVAGGCAGEPCQITLAAGIYKGMTADFVQSLMILIADLLDFSVLAIGASDEGVQARPPRPRGRCRRAPSCPFDALCINNPSKLPIASVQNTLGTLLCRNAQATLIC
jgi:hypothetical protein